MDIGSKRSGGSMLAGNQCEAPRNTALQEIASDLGTRASRASSLANDLGVITDRIFGACPKVCTADDVCSSAGPGTISDIRFQSKSIDDALERIWNEVNRLQEL